MATDLTGFVFSRKEWGEVNFADRGSRTLQFITVAETKIQARETLSRFFAGASSFQLEDYGEHVLKRAQKLGIGEGDGKAL